jgi:pimeloyl-ACP methyl ester carboxylesterase
LHRFDWNASYPGLTIPLLAIAGSEDILSPAVDIGRYAKKSGSAVVVEGAGHVLFDEAPQEVNALLTEFFSPMRPPYISGST